MSAWISYKFKVFDFIVIISAARTVLVLVGSGALTHIIINR